MVRTAKSLSKSQYDLICCMFGQAKGDRIPTTQSGSSTAKKPADKKQAAKKPVEKKPADKKPADKKGKYCALFGLAC